MYYFIKFLCGALFLYVAYCIIFFFCQRKIIFPCSLIEPLSCSDTEIGNLEKIWVATGCGQVEAWFLPPVLNHTAEPAPAVIFAHGNAELIDFWPEEFKKLTQLGIGVMLVEYPGYGRSAGTPSQKNIAAAFIAAYDLLVARHDVDPARIVLFGRSIGGGAVCELAKNRPSAALVLMSTFISIRSFAPKYLVPSFLILDPFDNQTVVASYKKPVLVIHGKRDDLIPYEHGVALSRAAKFGKMLSYDCGHNDCPPDWNIFWRAVELFLIDNGIIHALSGCGGEMPAEAASKMNKEILEIVNAKGVVLDQAPRDVIHGDNSLLHRVVHVVVRNGAGDILLQKRSANKDVAPGRWDTSVGGHMARGETILEALQREAKEEIGVACKSAVFMYTYIHRNAYESELVYTYECIQEGPFTLNKEEIDEIRFWSLVKIKNSLGKGILSDNFEDEFERILRHRQHQGRRA